MRPGTSPRPCVWGHVLYSILISKLRIHYRKHWPLNASRFRTANGKLEARFWISTQKSTKKPGRLRDKRATNLSTIIVKRKASVAPKFPWDFLSHFPLLPGTSILGTLTLNNLDCFVFFPLFCSFHHFSICNWKFLLS